MVYKRYLKNQRNYASNVSSHVSYMSALALKNASEVKKLKGMLNTELKYLDNADVATFGNTAVHVADSDPQYSLSQCAQGLDNNDRVGRQIKAKSAQIRIAIRHNAAGNISQTVRVLLIRAKVCDGDHPTLGDILQDVGNPRSFRKVSETMDATVLADRSVQLSAQDPIRTINIYKKMNSLVKYLGASASEANDGHGTILLYLFSDQLTDNFPTYSIQSRFRFIDN